ncbi:MAG: hypothetical protein R6U96_11560 [Promethearchaeia archaeon]
MSRFEGKHPEIKWTALYKQITKEHLEKLENPDSVPIKELREILRYFQIKVKEEASEAYMKKGGNNELNNRLYLNDKM